MAAFQSNVQNIFSTMGRVRLGSHDSLPQEDGAICIFIELLHLMPISLDLVTV